MNRLSVQESPFSPEYADGTFATIASVMAPRLIGMTIESAGDLQGALSDLKGNNFAKAALEMAWWQLRSSMDDRPLHDLLGATAVRSLSGRRWVSWRTPTSSSSTSPRRSIADTAASS